MLSILENNLSDERVAYPNILVTLNHDPLNGIIWFQSKQ